MFLLWMGCTWVSQSDYDQRLTELDDDGDSYTRDGGDCNDADPAIFPGADEIWYDGVDQDCGGDDDYDQDKDGWRQADAPDLTGPADCNDKNANIYPSAVDTWYDNIDSDCAGDDDFDADGDGVRAKNGGGDDCDDEPLDDADHGGPTAAETYPGADDTWYDGVDQDCAGNDDYDQDEDGYVPAQYFDGDTPPQTRWCPSCGDGNKGDCDDDPTDDDTSLIAAEDIYAGHTDTWYDGVDQDCAGNDDFDRDLDGYANDDFLDNGAVPDTLHCEDCPLSVPGDCDDTDPLYFIGAIEDPSSNDDQDCDGAADSVGVDADADIGWTLTDPYALRAADTSSELWFSVSARRVEDQNGTTYDDTAVGFSYSFANPDLGLQSINNWQSPGSNLDITAGQAFTIDGTDFLGATGLQGGSNRVLIVSRTPVGGSRSSVTAPQTLLTAVDAVDVAMVQDSNGVVHAISCDPLTGLHYVRAESSDFAAQNSGTYNLLYNSYAPQSCAIESIGNTGYVHYGDANDGGASVVMSFNTTSAPSFTELSREAADVTDVVLIRNSPELIVVTADQATGTITIERVDGFEVITPDADPVQVAAVLDPLDDDIVYITWADSDGNAGLAWGEVGTGFEVGRLETLYSVVEAVPWVSPSGADLFIGLMGTDEISVERITPPS